MSMINTPLRETTQKLLEFGYPTDRQKNGTFAPFTLERLLNKYQCDPKYLEFDGERYTFTLKTEVGTFVGVAVDPREAVAHAIFKRWGWLCKNFNLTTKEKQSFEINYLTALNENCTDD